MERTTMQRTTMQRTTMHTIAETISFITQDNISFAKCYVRRLIVRFINSEYH